MCQSIEQVLLYALRYGSPTNVVCTSTLLLALLGSAQAVTLAGIARAFSLDVGQVDDGPPWSAADSVENVKWLDKAPRQSSPGKYARYGKIDLQYYNEGSLYVTGSRDKIEEFHVSVTDKPRNVFNIEKTTTLLRRQFGSSARIKMLKACADGPTSGLATYRVTLHRRRPIYIVVGNDSNGNADPSRLMSFTGSYSARINANWTCEPQQVP